MAPHAIIQRTMWFYSIFFVILLNISHSQRLFDGVTLIDGSEVHIDFWSTQPPQWNRLRVHATNVGGSLYYTNGQDNSPQRGDRYTWIFEEQGDSIKFQSVYYPGNYLSLAEIPLPTPVYLFTTFSTTRKWYIVTKHRWWWMLIRRRWRHRFEADPLCTPATSRYVRIVPRFPCYKSSYFSAIMGWYSGLGVDLSQGKWQDMTGRGFSHANDINLNGVSLEVATQDSTGLPYLKGTLADSIVFKTTLPSYYTAVFLTRYRDTNQTTITECKRPDCAVGHRCVCCMLVNHPGTGCTCTYNIYTGTVLSVSCIKMVYVTTSSLFVAHVISIAIHLTESPGNQ
eukprot:1047666_1